MKYTVKLKACGNPDFRQGRTLPGVRARSVRVASLEEASRACLAYIAEHELGAGNWNGGSVFVGGNLIARVSYNGKVWPPGAWVPGMEPLWPVQVAS